MQHPFRTKFRRNEVANLCRRKGLRLVRFWSAFYKQWHYRTEPIRRYWKHLEREMLPVVGLEYCPTHVGPLTRVYYHMLNKPDMRVVKP